MDTIDQMLLPHVGWMDFESGDDVATFLRQGWFEHVEQAMLWLYARGGDTFLDVGAHVGLFSMIAQKTVLPGGRIFAVEPAPVTAGLLRRNLAGEATVIEAAAGQSAGHLALHSAGIGRAAYNTLIGDAHDGDAQVEVITIDQLMVDHGIERVDFMKLDVEGAELAAWRGAGQAVAQRRVGVAMIEFTEPNLQRAGTSSEELFAAVNDSGYVLCRFDVESRHLVPVQFTEPIWYDNLFATADVDAVNNRLRQAPEDRRRIAGDVLARGSVAKAVCDVAPLRRQVADLERSRDEALTALEIVRRDLQVQMGLRDQSYEAHGKTRDELRQTQNWLKISTQRAENAEARIATLKEELQQTQAELAEARSRIAQLEERLLVFCTSPYERIAWRTRLRKKPDWVDGFVADHRPAPQQMQGPVSMDRS